MKEESFITLTPGVHLIRCFICYHRPCAK